MVLGPQGSGKGTQAKKISATYGLPHISSGDLYREAIARGTELGKQVEPFLAAGRLVPDEITVAMIKDRLSLPDAETGFALDGFPRNLAQAEALDEMLGGIGRGLDAILFFDVPDDVGMERALKRAEIEGRSDDTIIRGGENVAPAEIEDVLRSHPEVTDCAVVGIEDDEWGQRIAAAVVVGRGGVTPEELRQFARARLRGSKTPDFVFLVEELPYTDTGKLLRRVVRDELTSMVAPSER